MRRAVFLDRDGTINEEVSYLNDPDRLRLIARCGRGHPSLKRGGILAIVVSNQAGVGRGYFSAATVEAIHGRLVELLAAQGARVDGVYYCPHHPSEGCGCRKPKAGMLVRAAREFGIDLRRAFMVGDKVSDLEAGQLVGCRTVLVLTGYGEQSQETFTKFSDFRPDYISTDLNGAAKLILAEKGVKA